MTDPTPDQIRQALDVLGIDPEDVNGLHAPEGRQAWSDHRARILHAILDRAVPVLSDPPVPVSRDTPAETVIQRSVDGAARRLLWTNGVEMVRTGAIRGELILEPIDGWMEYQRPDPDPTQGDERCCIGGCCGPGSWCCAHAGNHEHDPAPIPVEVGQTRWMPVRVVQAERGDPWVDVVDPEGDEWTWRRDVVASWTPQEET